MKNSSKTLFWAAAFAAFNLAAVENLPAQGKLNDINVVTVAFKLQLQSPGYNSQNGVTRSFAKPVLQTINTKNLLDRLALDKQAQGLYSGNTFPGGSKLALAANQFVVVSKNNEFIVDVSDIVSFSAGTNDILSGTVNNNTGLASSKTTELTLVTLKFDDTFITDTNGTVISSDLSFSGKGLDTINTKDSTPNSAGKYNENTSDKISNAVGEGQSGGKPFVMTGTIQGSRNATLTRLPPAT